MPLLKGVKPIFSTQMEMYSIFIKGKKEMTKQYNGIIPFF